MGRRGKPSQLAPAEKRGIQSIDVGISVLSQFAAFPGSVSLKDLSDAVDMPSSKVHRYLASFIRTGLVSQDPATGKYDLGPQALQLGLAAIARLDLVDLATRHMTRLTEDHDVMSVLSVWSQHGPTVIRIKRGAENIFSSIALGSVLPTIRSATGQVFLAYLPDAMVENQVKAGLKEAKTLENAGPKNKRELSAVIKQVHDQGYASVYSLYGTAFPRINAVAVPVLDIQGEAAAVISLMSGFKDLADINNPITKELIRTTKEISAIANSDS